MKNDNEKLKNCGGFYFCVIVFHFLFFIFNFASAADQNSLTITITPPIFQMTATPGQNWSSAIKVVNNNSYDITVYASVMNFRAEGEGGTGKLVPADDTRDVAGEYTLASWFDVSRQPIFIPAERSASVPFTLRVPENAEPGGHYGAILIGTEPPPKTGGSSVRVASQLSSIFLVRVNGDIEEKGDIRSFSTKKMLYQEPRAIFDLRFENTGNVHLLPRGDIAVYNMWGKERGKILVNQEAGFGNVLPRSIRKFTFEWVGEQSFFDVGRYKAVATLAFGENKQETAYRAAYFWVIPVGPVLKITAFLILLVWFFVWSVRRYVKRALAIESERLSALSNRKEAPLARQPALITRVDTEILTRPIVLGVVDLRKAVQSGDSADRENMKEKMTLFRFSQKYRLFLIFLAAAIFGVIGISKYLDDVLVRYRNFDVRVMREDARTENAAQGE